MLEIFVIVYGIIVMIRGKSTMSKDQELVGWRARVIGAILLGYLPISFGVGIVIGLTSGAEVGQGTAWVASIIVLVVVLIVAFVVSKVLYRGQLEGEA